MNKMLEETTSEEAKELYAHFGLSFYCSSVLEHGVANALLILELFEDRGGATTRQAWEALVDRHYENSFANTLGKLIRLLARHRERSPALADIVADLEKCLTERNFLAHHFWRENAASWYSRKGRASMVHRLETARDLFSETDKKLDAAMQPLADRYGLTADAVRNELERMKEDISK